MNTPMCLQCVECLSEHIRRSFRKVKESRNWSDLQAWIVEVEDYGWGKLKDREEEGQKEGMVYEIKCGDCEKCYIGEAGRNADTRVKEHRTHA